MQEEFVLRCGMARCWIGDYICMEKGYHSKLDLVILSKLLSIEYIQAKKRQRPITLYALARPSPSTLPETNYTLDPTKSHLISVI